MKISMKCGLLFGILCIILLPLPSASAQTPFKIYLAGDVGDAGDHMETGNVLEYLHTELLNNPNSAVIFLGDNSYKDVLWPIIPFGFKGFDSTANTIKKVRSQLDIVNQYRGSVYFTPGNHDWWNRTTYEKGKPKLVMEESYIEENLKQNTTIANRENVFLPKNGNYGPEYVELNEHTIRLVFIDTYRIIQTGIKKGKIPEEEKSFYVKLDSIIKDGYLLKQKIIVIGHHPVYSMGPYNKVLKHPYLFARIKASNATFPSYQAMAVKINEILHRYPGIYYASGHIHALEYFQTEDSIHFIISGAGSKEKSLSNKEIARYDDSLKQNEYLKWNTGGFFEIEFNGQNAQTFLYYNNGSLKCSLP
jgi:hypothetical protein